MSFAATTGRDDRRPSPPNILRGGVGGVNSSRSPSAGANNNNTSRSQSVQHQHQHVAFQSPLPAIPTLAIPQNLGRLLRQQQNGRDGSASQAPLSSRRSPASTYRRNQSPQATFRSNGGDITARSVRHGSPPSAAVASGGFIPAFAQDVLHLSSATPLLPQHMLRYVQFHSGKSRDDIPELESFFTHGRSVVHTMPNVFVRCMTLVNGEMWIGERGGAISRWGAHDAELIQRAERSNRSLLVCCMMPVGLHVWCGMSDGTLKILHPSDATRIIKEIKEHAGAITCMELSFNEHYVFTGSSDFIVTQWSATEGSRVQAFSGHHAAVRCLRVVGIRLFSGADDGHIIEWDVARGKSLHILNGHKSAVRCLQASTMYLWSGGEDATVRVWLLESDMNTPSWVTDAPAIAAGENEATLEGLQRVMSQQRTSTMKAIREAKYKRAGGVVLLPQTDGADGAENGEEVGGRPSYAQEQDRATALAGVLDARLPPPVCQHIITSPFTASVTHLQAVGNKMWSVSLGTVYVWNNRTFALEAQFREHEGMLSATHTVRQSVLSRVWTAGTEGNVLLWNVECNYQSALESSSDLHTAHLEHSLEQHFLREEKLAADALIHRTANERLSTEIDSLQQELRALHNAKRLSEVNLQSQIHELEDTVRARDATIEALRAESLALSERLGVPVSGREMRLKLLAEQACRGSVLVAETDPLASKMEASMDALAMLSKELETLHQERLISAQAKLAAAREKKEQQLILESQERERQQQQLLAALSPSSSSGLRRKGSSSRSHSRMRSSDSMMSSRSSSHHLLPEDNEDDATTTTADDTPSKLSKKRRSHSSGGRREEGAAPGHVRMRSSDSIVSVGSAGHAGLPVKDAALPTTVDSSISREQHIDAAPEDATAVVEECDPRTSKVVTPPPSAIALVSTNDAEAAHNGTDTMVALGSPLSQSQKRMPAADTKPTAGPTSQPTIPAAAPLLVEPTSFAGNDFAIADCNRLRQDLHHVYAWCASLQRAVADLHGACALVLSSADTTEENVVNTSVPSVPPKKVEFSTSAALTDGAVLVMRSRPVDDHDESEGTSERGGTTREADLDLDALGWLSIRELSPEDRAEVVRLLDCGVCKLVLSQKPTTTTTSSSTLPQEVSSYNCASASTTTLPSLVVFPHWSELSSHNDNNTSWFLSLVPRYRRQHHSDATGAASPSELFDSRTFAQQSLPTAVASRHELALSGPWRPTAFSRGKSHTSSTVLQPPKAQTEPVSTSVTTSSCDEEAPTTDHQLSERDSSVGGATSSKQQSSSAIDARVGVVGYQSVLSDISGTLVDVDRTVSMLASQLLSKDNSLMHQLRIRENALRLSSALLKQCGGVNGLAALAVGSHSREQQDSSSSPQRLLLDEEIQTYLDDLKLHTTTVTRDRKVIVESMNTLRDAKNQMKEFEADLLAGAFVVDDPSSRNLSTTNESAHEDIASLGDVVALEVKEAVQQHDSLSMTTIASLRRSGVEFTCVSELQEQFFALLQERSQYACDLENAMKGFDCLTTQLAHDVLLHDRATDVVTGDHAERSLDRGDGDDDADASSRTRDSMVASECSDDSDDRSSSLISGESSSSSYADNSGLQAARRAQHEAAEAEQKQKRQEILDSQSHPLVIRARDSLFPDVSRVLATARRTHDEHQVADEAAQAAVHEISETLPTVKHNLPLSETDLLLLPAETHSSITTTTCLAGGDGEATTLFNQRMNDMRSLVTHLCSVTTALSRRCDELSHAWQRDLGEYYGQQQIIEAICDDAIQQVTSPESGHQQQTVRNFSLGGSELATAQELYRIPVVASPPRDAVLAQSPIAEYHNNPQQHHSIVMRGVSPPLSDLASGGVVRGHDVSPGSRGLLSPMSTAVERCQRLATRLADVTAAAQGEKVHYETTQRSLAMLALQWVQRLRAPNPVELDEHMDATFERALLLLSSSSGGGGGVPTILETLGRPDEHLLRDAFTALEHVVHFTAHQTVSWKKSLLDASNTLVDACAVPSVDTTAEATNALKCALTELCAVRQHAVEIVQAPTLQQKEPLETSPNKKQQMRHSSRKSFSYSMDSPEKQNLNVSSLSNVSAALLLPSPGKQASSLLPPHVNDAPPLVILTEDVAQEARTVVATLREALSIIQLHRMTERKLLSALNDTAAEFPDMMQEEHLTPEEPTDASDHDISGSDDAMALLMKQMQQEPRWIAMCEATRQRLRETAKSGTILGVEDALALESRRAAKAQRKSMRRSSLVSTSSRTPALPPSASDASQGVAMTPPARRSSLITSPQYDDLSLSMTPAAASVMLDDVNREDMLRDATTSCAEQVWRGPVELLRQQRDVLRMWCTLVSSFARTQHTAFTEKEERLMRVIRHLSGTQGEEELRGAPPQTQQMAPAPLKVERLPGWFTATSAGGAVPGVDTGFTDTSTEVVLTIPDDIEDRDADERVAHDGEDAASPARAFSPGKQKLLSPSAASATDSAKKKRVRHSMKLLSPTKLTQRGGGGDVSLGSDDDDDDWTPPTKETWLHVTRDLDATRQQLALMLGVDGSPPSYFPTPSAGAGEHMEEGPNDVITSQASPARSAASRASGRRNNIPALLSKVLPLLERYHDLLKNGITYSGVGCQAANMPVGNGHNNDPFGATVAETTTTLAARASTSPAKSDDNCDQNSTSSNEFAIVEEADETDDRERQNRGAEIADDVNGIPVDPQQPSREESSDTMSNSDESVSEEQLMEAFDTMRRNLILAEEQLTVRSHADHIGLLNAHVLLQQRYRRVLESVRGGLLLGSVSTREHIDEDGDDDAIMHSNDMSTESFDSDHDSEASSLHAPSSREELRHPRRVVHQLHIDVVNAGGTTRSEGPIDTSATPDVVQKLRQQISETELRILPDLEEAARRRIKDDHAEAADAEELARTDRLESVLVIKRLYHLVRLYETAMRHSVAAARGIDGDIEALLDAEMMEDDKEVLAASAATTAASDANQPLVLETASVGAFTERSQSFVSSIAGRTDRTGAGSLQRVDSEMPTLQVAPPSLLHERLIRICIGAQRGADRLDKLLLDSDTQLSHASVDVLHTCNIVMHKYTRSLDKLLHMGSIPPPWRPKLARQFRGLLDSAEGFAEGDDTTAVDPTMPSATSQKPLGPTPAAAPAPPPLEVLRTQRELHQQLTKRMHIVEVEMEKHKIHLRDLPTYSAWAAMLKNDVETLEIIGHQATPPPAPVLPPVTGIMSSAETNAVAPVEVASTNAHKGTAASSVVASSADTSPAPPPVLRVLHAAMNAKLAQIVQVLDAKWQARVAAQNDNLLQLTQRLQSILPSRRLHDADDTNGEGDRDFLIAVEEPHQHTTGAAQFAATGPSSLQRTLSSLSSADASSPIKKTKSMRKTLSTSPRRGFSKPSEGQSQHPSESVEESLNPPSHTSFSPPSASAVKRRGVSFVMSPDEKAQNFARNNRNSANTPEAKDKWPTLLKDEARLLETTHRLLQDLDASTVDLHKKNDELTESLRVNQTNMTSLQEQLHKLIEELDGSEATVATQEGELRALRQFKSNRDDIVSGLRDVSTTTDSRLIDTYEMLFDQSDNARRQLVRQVEDLERTNSQLWTVVQRHESGAALLNAGNLFDDDDDDTATVVPDSSSNNNNATVNGANTAAALSNNLGEGETDADDVHLLQTVNDIASVSAQVDSESDLKATERSTDSVVPNNNSSAIRLKLVPRASETAPTQSPHYMRSTIARSPIVDNRTSTPNRRPAGQSTPSPLRKASPNPLRPGIPSSSNHTAGGVFSLLDANALTLNKSLLAALGPFEAAPLLAKAAEAIQLLRNQLQDIEAAVRQHRDDFDVLILPIVQTNAGEGEEVEDTAASVSKEKHRHQQQQQQLVEAMQRYERIRAVQWEDHCAVSKQMYDTYQHITEILLKSLKRLHRVGFLVETRPPMLRATYEMYTVLLLCIRSISGFAKLTNEGRMSRREALGNVDRIADEVATATEGAAWMLANLFTDDELAHVGASPHLLPPDVKRPTWRDVRLPNHYQQSLDALATADRSVSPGREAGGGPQQQGGHATGTTSQNGIGTPRSVHGIVGTSLSTPSMTTIGTHSAGGGGGASRTRFESPVHSQRSGAMGGGGSALPVRTTLRLATPPRRNNFTDPLESSTNSSLTLNTPTKLNQTTTTSGGNMVMSPRPRHFSRR